MGYLARKRIIHMATGQSWPAGSRIGERQLPAELVEQLLGEGVLEQVQPPAAEPEPEPEPAPTTRSRRGRSVKVEEAGDEEE